MKKDEYKGIILIVDDNPDNLGILFDYLSYVGFRVLLSQDGESALEQAREHQPDIILLDVMMPGIDGFETCRLLKEDDLTQEIPVVFMTALSETMNKVRGFDAGGVDYITKPLRHEEVLARVNTHLTIRNLQKKLSEQNDLLQEKNKKLESLNIDLTKKNEELRVLNASKDRFFSIIAHDLKNPFTSFVLGTEILTDIDGLSPDRIKTVATNLNRAAQRMQSLLENLLYWARLQMGAMSFESEELDLKAVVQASIYLLESNLAQKDLTIINHIQQDVFVNADSNMVETILRNLLTNAYKFTPRGGKIEISIEERNDFVQISVADTGVGISEENIQKLFKIDDNYRKNGTENEKGTGLGLILCKDLVEKHGGKIWLESIENKGSTFYFTLPRKPE